MSNDKYRIDIELATKDAQASVERLSKTLQAFEGQTNKYTKSSGKSLDKLGDQGKKTGDKFQDGFKRSNIAFGAFTGALAAGIALGALRQLSNAASSLFRMFTTEGIRAAQKQEDAENRLAQALARTGQYSKEAHDEFKAYAAQLQSVTKFGDEVILENAALIQSLGNLSTDGLQEATKAALDMAAALSIDLRTASQMVGRAAQGDVTLFRRYGVTIEQGKDNAETFANALEALNRQFGGAASADVQTYAGRTQQLSNSWGDLQEQMGFVFTTSAPLIEAMNEIRMIFDELGGSVEENRSFLQSFVNDGIVALTRAVPAMVKVVASAINTFSWWKTTIAELQLLNARFTIAVGKEARERRRMHIAEAEAAVDAAAKQQAQMRVSMNDAIAVAEDSAKRIREAAKRGADSQDEYNEMLRRQSDAARAAADANEVLTEAQKKVLAQEDARLKGIVQAMAQERDSAEATFKYKMELLNQELEQEEITREEYHERHMQLLQERFDEELLLVEEAKRRELVTEEEHVAAIEILERRKALATRKAEQDRTKFHEQEKQKRLAQEKRQNDIMLQGTADLFGALANVAAMGGRKQFETQKNLATAQAITQGILAVQRAIASAPPPFNVPAIAATTIQTGVNVARIRSQQPPRFAQGGIVPGSSFVGDRVHAQVNSGEMILNRQQQRQLFDIANGKGGDSAKLDRAISLLTQVVNQPVSVQIDGREIVNATRSQLESGRTL